MIEYDKSFSFIMDIADTMTLLDGDLEISLTTFYNALTLVDVNQEFSLYLSEVISSSDLMEIMRLGASHEIIGKYQISKQEIRYIGIPIIREHNIEAFINHIGEKFNNQMICRYRYKG